MPYLNKLKRKDFPKSPNSVDEIVSAFEDDEIKRLYGKHYVHTQSPIPRKTYGFTILCDHNILKVIKDIPKREIFMDGTFEIVRRGPYQQLLILYVGFKRDVIFLIHFISI